MNILIFLILTINHWQNSAFANVYISERIVGGEITDISQYCHQVSVRLYGYHICGGALIDNCNVLTASHCVDGQTASTISIEHSTSKLNGDKKNVIQAKSLHMNCQYDRDTIDYDIAIIHLEKCIDKEAIAKPIKLATVTPTTGTLMTVTGWGTTSENGAVSQVIRKVNVPMIERDICAKKYEGYPITPRMMCAGFDAGGKDACQGDSGGPGIVNNELVGIVSWGAGCARSEYPGVYVNIANINITNWIKSTCNNGLQGP